MISCLWWLSQISYAQNIVQYEYSIDNKEPTVKDINPSDEDVSITFEVKEELTEIEDGLHFLGVRVMDENGKWSVPTYRTFLMQTVRDLPNIVKAEYIIDNLDPKEIEIPTESTDVEIPTFEVDLEGISPGLHFLQVRVQDAFQRWSVVMVRAFLVDDGKELEKISKLNYYYYDIADETVVGDFNEAIDPPATSVEMDFQANATLLENGKEYLLYIWAETETGKLSLANIQKFTFIDRPPIVVEFDSTNVTCFDGNDGSFTAKASGGKGEPYEYKLEGGEYQEDGVFENLSAGYHIIYVRDVEKTYEHKDSVYIGQPEAIGLELSVKTDLDCAGDPTGSITVSITNQEDEIEFSIDGENFQESSTFANLEAGTYIIIAKNQNGCTESIEAELVALNYAPPIPEIDSDGSTLTVTNVFTGEFQWYKDGVAIPGADQSTYECDGPGTYKVQVSNGECFSESEERNDVCGPPPPSVEITSSDLSCFGADDGKITVSPSDEESSYTYSLDGENFSEENEFTNLAASEYTVYTKDSEGTEATKKVTITSPDKILISIDEVIDASCPGVANGSIVVSATGGTGNLMFKLNDGDFQDGTFEGLSAGEYTITVQDEKGCPQTADITIQNLGNGPAEPMILREGNENSIESSLSINETNGHSVQWIKDGEDLEGETQQILELSEAGEYTAVLIDANGCRSEPGEIMDVTGMEEIIEATTKVYPVPAKSWVKVEVPYSKTDDIIGQLMNTQGQVLKRMSLKPDGNVVVAEFETGTLPDGLYFILLQGEDFNVIKKLQKVSR